MKRHRFIGIIGLLVLLDQSIKVIINQYFRNQKINIISDYVRFEPHLNVDFSWVNSMLDLGLSRIFHIALVFFLFVLLCIIFKYMGARNTRDKWVDSIFILVFSGAICSFIDKVFWGGSLDYIALKGLFIFDLKDMYVTIFEIMLIGMAIFNYKGFLKINEKELFRDFKRFFKSEIIGGSK